MFLYLLTSLPTTLLFIQGEKLKGWYMKALSIVMQKGMTTPGVVQPCDSIRPWEGYVGD